MPKTQRTPSKSRRKESVKDTSTSPKESETPKTNITPKTTTSKGSLRRYFHEQISRGDESGQESDTQHESHGNQGSKITLNTIGNELERISKFMEGMASKDYINAKIDKLVTMDALTASLSRMQESIKNDMMEEIRKVNRELDQLKGETHDVCVQNEALKKKVSEFEKKEVEMSDRVSRFEATNGELCYRNEELQQYTRADTVRIFGLEDKDAKETSEQCTDKVVLALQNKLQIAVTKHDISIAHRLGRFDKNTNRPIICKFTRRSVKLDAIRNRKKLKGTAVIIKEDITPATKILMDNLKLQPHVASVWFFDTKVFIKLWSGRIVRIRSWSDLPADQGERENVAPVDTVEQSTQ